MREYLNLFFVQNTGRHISSISIVIIGEHTCILWFFDTEWDVSMGLVVYNSVQTNISPFAILSGVSYTYYQFLN
jgi:hypothetical protein